MKSVMVVAAVVLLLGVGLVLGGRRVVDPDRQRAEPFALAIPTAPADPLEAERLFRAELAEMAPDDSTASATLAYNLGTSLHLQRRYEEARPHLSAAENAGGEVAPSAAYNLGNTDLEPAFADTLLPDRRSRILRAIEAYRRSLLRDPADLDAKWNLEVAYRLLEEEPPTSGGGGGGGGGDGPPEQGEMRPDPSPADGPGPEPESSMEQADELLRAAQERERQVQRESFRKPQPPGPIRP